MAETNYPGTPPSGSGHYVSRVLQWNPQEDITPYEIALAVPIIALALARRTTEADLAAHIAALPQPVKRHFRSA